MSRAPAKTSCPPQTSDMTSFINRVFEDVNKVGMEMKSWGSGWALNPIRVSLEDTERDTLRSPCEHRGGWRLGDVATSQVTPGNVGHCQDLREGPGSNSP